MRIRRVCLLCLEEYWISEFGGYAVAVQAGCVC